ASMFTVVYSLRFIYEVFFGPRPADLPRIPQEAPRWMRFPVELLVLACLVVGTMPSLTVGPALDAAVRSVVGPSPPPYSLAVWHGFTPELLMSALVLTGGTGLYFWLRPSLFSRDKPPLLGRISGRRIFDR